MSLQTFWQSVGLEKTWQAIEASSVATYVASSETAFPMIETVHVIAIITVIGAIAIMDMRLLGLASRNNQVTAVARDTLPLTWIAFLVAAITGSLLFVSKASTYMINPYFLAKMVTMGLAGANMILFHSTGWRSVASWDSGRPVPRAAKISAGLSLFFWFFVIFFGRLIGFTLGIYAPT